MRIIWSRPFITSSCSSEPQEVIVLIAHIVRLFINTALKSLKIHLHHHHINYIVTTLLQVWLPMLPGFWCGVKAYINVAWWWGIHAVGDQDTFHILLTHCFLTVITDHSKHGANYVFDDNVQHSSFFFQRFKILNATYLYPFGQKKRYHITLQMFSSYFFHWLNHDWMKISLLTQTVPAF